MGWVGSGHTKWTHGQLCASARLATVLHLSVCVYLCLSQVGILSKQMNGQAVFFGKKVSVRPMCYKEVRISNTGLLQSQTVALACALNDHKLVSTTSTMSRSRGWSREFRRFFALSLSVFWGHFLLHCSQQNSIFTLFHTHKATSFSVYGTLAQEATFRSYASHW